MIKFRDFVSFKLSAFQGDTDMPVKMSYMSPTYSPIFNFPHAQPVAAGRITHIHLFA